MSTSKQPQHPATTKPAKAVKQPGTGQGKAMSDEDLKKVSGGLNPQPFPPKHSNPT